MVWFVLLRFLLAGSGIGLRGWSGHDLSLWIIGAGQYFGYAESIFNALYFLRWLLIRLFAVFTASQLIILLKLGGIVFSCSFFM